MNDEEVYVGIVKITNENRNSLLRLAIAMRYEGSKCTYCGYEYQSVDDFIAHKPKKGFESDDVVCADCWNSYLNSKQTERIEDVDEQLNEEMSEELLKFEDDVLAKKKRRIPKIHGAKEKRYIP